MGSRVEVVKDYAGIPWEMVCDGARLFRREGNPGRAVRGTSERTARCGAKVELSTAPQDADRDAAWAP